MFWRRRSPSIVKITIEADMTTPAGQALVQAIQDAATRLSQSDQAKQDAAVAAATQDLQTKLDAANQALAEEQQAHADDLAAGTQAAEAIAPENPPT